MRKYVVGAVLSALALLIYLTGLWVARQPSHRLGDSRVITAPSYQLLPGFRLVTHGLSLVVLTSPRRITLASDEVLRLSAYDQGEREDKVLEYDSHGQVSMALRASFQGKGSTYYAIQVSPFSLLPALGKDGKTYPGNYLMVEASICRDGMEVEKCYLHVLEQPLVAENKATAIMADRVLGQDERVAAANLKEALKVIDQVNRFITRLGSDDPDVPHKTIQEVGLHISPDQDSPHSYVANPQWGDITGTASEVDMSQLLLSGLLHESMHVVFPNLKDWQKQKLYTAFGAFKRLAGYKAEERLVSHLFGPAAGVDENPVFQVVAESGVLSMHSPDGASVGHPYESANEFFASTVAMIVYAPDGVRRQLAALPPAKQKAFRLEVLGPCADVFGLDGPGFIRQAFAQFLGRSEPQH